MNFDELRTSFALTVGDLLLPGAGGYEIGAVASISNSEDSSLQFIDNFRKEIESLGMGNPGITPIEDPWKFMRRAAGEGLAGLQSIEPDNPSLYTFMIRVEEAGSDLPTILAKAGDERHTFLTRMGERQLDPAEVLHWERYDILDRVISRFGERCPFRHWHHGDPLYELTSDGGVFLIANVPLMGDWNPPDGAFAFFTSEEEACRYANFHLYGKNCRVISTADPGEAETDELTSDLKITQVDDLQTRLKALSRTWGIAAWCINPEGHRESSGFGLLWESKNGEGFVLRSVSGNWHVRPDNIFERTDEPVNWSGSDTLFWSGGQSLQLLPLDVSFGTDQLLIADSTVDMSDVETEHWIDDFLSQPSNQELVSEDFAEPSIENFYISCWDAVTGEKHEPAPSFNGFLEGLRFLAAYERDHDAQFRLEGASSCSSIGFAGSGDEGHEALRGEKFQRGLRNLAKRHFSKGYHPSYAADLVALANATLRTLHIDFAGYAKDILWSMESDDTDELLDEMSIDQEAWDEWKYSAETTVDPRGKALLIARLGEQIWELLNSKTRHFLTTAMLQLDRQGHAPQLDYAPVSMEIVKGLEVEMGGVLERFRENLQGKVIQGSDKERDFAAFLYDGKKIPSLGAISYLFRKTVEGDSPLKIALNHYISSLPNGDFLTSNRFTKRDLQKVINRYRNGGVHDSPIPEDVCLSCVESLIGTIENPGLIVKVVQWKSAVH